MFNQNKYTKWYFNIINVAKERSVTEYCESHHIIPKCLGGGDTSDNIVKLTAREHFICHLLLIKMHASRKLKYALICMTLKNPHQQCRYVPNSHVYDRIKKINSQLSSERCKGKQKHNVGKRNAYDPITLKQKLFFPDQIPDGWIMGSSPLTKKNQIGKNKGKVYYNNTLTGETIALSENEEIPIGFVKGNPNAATAPSTGTKLYHDPITLETKRCVEPPAGWEKGSIFVWINNGFECKQHSKFDSLPNGWVKGRLNWR